MAVGLLVRGFWGSTSIKAPFESGGDRPATTQGLAVAQTPNLITTNTKSVTQAKVHDDAPKLPLLKHTTEAERSRPSSASTTSIKNSGLRVDTSTKDVGEKSDWKACLPPPELLEVAFEAAPEIQNIITSSVERVQERLSQARFARENSESKKGKERMVLDPIVVVDSPAPSRDVKIQTPTPHAPSQSRMSVITASSGDSGYVSSPITQEPPKRRTRAFSRLVGWASRDKEAFSISAIVNPTSGHAHSISTPMSVRPLSEKTSSPAASPSRVLTKECISCLDDFRPREVITLSCHSYCKPCFTALISTALGSETYWPPKCCLNEIPVEILLSQMDRMTRNLYKKTAEERSVPAGDRIYCYSCTTWVPPKNINKAIACAVCQPCRKKTCTSCRDAYHSNGDCPADPNMRATLKLAEEQGWRRCYSCKAMVEHNTGCLHMTCKCKAQFCYVCGIKWRTCSCSDTALATILATAVTRRLEAQARERREIESRQRAAGRGTTTSLINDVEPADLQDILARIEEFETNEAIQIANETEKRRIEVEAAQQHRQEERIMIISKKYHDLRNELEALHFVQRLTIADRFNDELFKLHKQAEILLVNQAKESEALKASSRARIENFEKSLDAVFEEKKAKERGIESDYLYQLQEFWSGHPQKDVEIEMAINALSLSHHEAQLRWRANERAKAKDFMDAETVKVDAMTRRHDREMSLISQDEGRMDTERLGAEDWFITIVKERNTMLGSLEDEDYATAYQEAEVDTDEVIQALQQPQRPSWGFDDELDAAIIASASASISSTQIEHGSERTTSNRIKGENRNASASVSEWTEFASVMARSRPIPSRKRAASGAAALPEAWPMRPRIIIPSANLLDEYR